MQTQGGPETQVQHTVTVGPGLAMVFAIQHSKWEAQCMSAGTL